MKLIGFSTGALAYGDFKTAIKVMRKAGVNAIELSALRRHELDPLVASIDDLDISDFLYISVHAPSKFNEEDEVNVIKLLESFAAREWPIVIHPDSIRRIERWRVFGKWLLIENMDSRKKIGRTVQEIDKIFASLPDARFCFDIAHARQYDPTMHEAELILQRFNSLITQVHLSDIGGIECKHIPLSPEAVIAYKKLANLIPSNAAVILESIIEPSEIRIEIESALSALSRNDGSKISCLPLIPQL